MKRDRKDLIISALGVLIILLITILIVDVLGNNERVKVGNENSKVESYYKINNRSE